MKLLIVLIFIIILFIHLGVSIPKILKDNIKVLYGLIIGLVIYPFLNKNLEGFPKKMIVNCTKPQGDSQHTYTWIREDKCSDSTEWKNPEGTISYFSAPTNEDGSPDMQEAKICSQLDIEKDANLECINYKTGDKWKPFEN